MDWTGGTRRRFAGKGKSNAVLQKQKAHFAKVNAQKQQPFETPDFLRDAIASRPHQPPISSSHQDTTQQSIGNHSERSAFQHSVRYSGDETSPRKRHAIPDELDEQLSLPRSSGRYGIASADAKHDKATSVKPQRPTTETDEERLLLANRERLLARHDWLGLSAARPLRMKFPEPSDKANVGKRRKIQRSGDHKAKPARQRSRTPLFRQELRPRDVTPSNAKQNNDMNIKIGTDAFASQTQTSRQSHSLANTSMRQPSTEFGPISEESMLLGVDGDGFELKTDQSGPLRELHGALRNDDTGPSYDFVEPTVSMAPSLQLSQDSEPTSTVLARHHMQDHPATRYHEHHAFADPRRYPVCEDPDAANENDLDLDVVVPGPFDVRTANAMSEQMVLEDDDDDDDETFRTLMKADATLSGKSSMAAMASSSVMQPAPMTISQPQHAIREQQEPRGYSYAAGHDILVPRSNSMIAERAETTKSEQYGHTDTATSIAFGSPSNSLRQLYRTTSRPTEVTQMPAEPPNEDEDEAMWRSLYLKSQGSDSATSDLAETVQKTWVAKSDDAIQPADYSSSSKARTEKLMSDKATFGGSVMAGYEGSEDEDEDAEEESSQQQTNTSMIGHATTVAPEFDDIDDIEREDDAEDRLEPRSFTTGNIHATSARSADYHKRFAERKRSTRPSFEKAPRFESSKYKGRRQEASTYAR